MSLVGGWGWPWDVTHSHRPSPDTLAAPMGQGRAGAGGVWGGGSAPCPPTADRCPFVPAGRMWPWDVGVPPWLCLVLAATGLAWGVLLGVLLGRREWGHGGGRGRGDMETRGGH